jgi:hypothetical protein
MVDPRSYGFQIEKFSELWTNNSYMIYIIRNPIHWLGMSAYGGGVFGSLFFDRRCSRTTFFRNVNKMAAWIPDNNKR